MQGKYPIWDSRVRRYLSALSRQLKNADDAGLLGTNPHLWTLYPEFVESITGLRRRSRLAAFPFKDIDKFLWKFGRDPEDDAASITTPSTTRSIKGPLRNAAPGASLPPVATSGDPTLCEIRAPRSLDGSALILCCSQKLANRPDVVSDLRFHCRCTSNRPMRSAEVIPAEV